MWTWPRLVAVLCVGTLAETVRLTCRLGELEGIQRTTPRTGRPYFAFTSIPYAQPPIGPLRLRNPVPLDHWEGVLDATKQSPPCIQNPVFFPNLRETTIGQEDCLHLNIYSPTADPGSKLSVLVYIHGGALRAGHPVRDPGAETNFVEEDVVLVTVHYRLGVLGFLSTEDSEIPGNFGLKDQALAIKWVSENIEAFGGDPSTITVFGGSSGATSVHYLITSPLSRDLLKGGIAQSGVNDASWAVATPGRAGRYANKVAEFVGCDFDSDVLACLQSASAQELQNVELNLLVWDFDPVVVFQPVIEPKDDGAFLTEDPRKMEVTAPFMTGINTGEGLFKTASLLHQDDSLLDEFINNFDEFLPQILFMEPDRPRLSDFISIIKGKYFYDLSDREDTIKGLENLYADFFVIYPTYQALQRHKGPKYGYIFDHKAETSLVDLRGTKKFKMDRPCHGDELLSLFNWTSSFPNKKGREEDEQVSIQLVKLWTNFAKHQNPTPEKSDASWRQYEDGNFFLITAKNNEMVHWSYDDVIEFWEKTIKIVEPSKTSKEEL